MHFHANYVSTSVFGDGDYYQATFEAEQDTDDPDSPYLLIQRQFEDPDDHRCYIERMTKNIAVIFYYAALISSCRSCQSSSIVRGTILSACPLRWWPRSSPKHRRWQRSLVARSSLPDPRSAKSNVPSGQAKKDRHRRNTAGQPAIPR
jgi:hypothetical protein